MTSHFPVHIAPRPKPLSVKKQGILAVVDVGSHKIACAITRMKPAEASIVLPGRTHIAEVLGFGHQRSEGIKSGAVIDARAAEQAIRSAIDHAERAAGMEIGSILLNVSCGRLKGQLYGGAINIRGGQIHGNDIQDVCGAAIADADFYGRTLLHCVPKSFSLDDTHDIHAPSGLLGQRLGVELHVGSVDSAALGNVMACVERCHLNVEGVIATPYASGLAVLADDEARLGAIVIDIGAGTTTIAVFSGGLVYMDSIAIGGQHITNDIARGLSTRVTIAERLKTLHGSAISTSLDEREFLTIAPVGAPEHDGPHHIPRSKVVSIIRPRVDEILELIRDKLNAAPISTIGRNVVITGGTAQLAGLVDVAKIILNRPVRIGRPLGVSGLPEAAKGPAFATLTGMLIAPQLVRSEVSVEHDAHGAHFGAGNGYLGRMGQWLKENF